VPIVGAMSNVQPPRPSGMGGPPRPGGANGTGAFPPKIGGGVGGPKPPTPKVKAPTARTLLLVFLGLVLLAAISVYLTPSPLSHPAISVGSVIGGLTGLFGCTITFGLYRFVVDQQSAANTFSEWNFSLSRGRLARIATIVGWLAGAINCYLISYEVAREFVEKIS
jgi:hypothetical protein